MPDGRAKIVIVGAGFGGIEAAKSLRRAPVELTVIDRQNHHCFQPLLYQVATAALSPADVAWPIRHILRKQKNATVLMAEVRAVDHWSDAQTMNPSHRLSNTLVARPGSGVDVVGTS
jgi:NADH:ubiquinone reductase (H+-translocating)